MSVYDELNDCIESAWSSDSCEYEVCSEMFDLIADAEYKYDNLKAENAKLRELVRDMCICMCNITDADYTCKDCLLSNDTRNCDFERRMEELGIEAE